MIPHPHVSRDCKKALISSTSSNFTFRFLSLVAIVFRRHVRKSSAEPGRSRCRPYLQIQSTALLLHPSRGRRGSPAASIEHRFGRGCLAGSAGTQRCACGPSMRPPSMISGASALPNMPAARIVNCFHRSRRRARMSCRRSLNTTCATTRPQLARVEHRPHAAGHNSAWTAGTNRKPHHPASSAMFFLFVVFSASMQRAIMQRAIVLNTCVACKQKTHICPERFSIARTDA